MSIGGIIWGNVWSWPNRAMARYLRRRGWVAFYLDPQSRECGHDGMCWMRVYKGSQKRQP